MKKYLNETGLPYSTAVWLAKDHYQYDKRENSISVTSLMKSTRQNILHNRLGEGDALVDISTLLASRLGTALHASYEDAWLNHKDEALKALGVPKRAREAVEVNPDVVDPDKFQVWLEITSEREVGGMVITGTADMIMDGHIRDLKSTSTWSYTSGQMDHKYILQMSLYRWLNQDKVTSDVGYIDFLFKDFNPRMAGKDGYPKAQIVEKAYNLIPIHTIENYVIDKVIKLQEYKDTQEMDLPICTDREMGITSSEWKYYSKPDAKRATKNFKEDKTAAYAHAAKQGKGVVKEVKGERCRFCPVKSVCSNAPEPV